jgi:MYXO-CTERM domain-containing protein
VTTAFADGAVSLVGRVDAWGAVNAPASASLPNLGVTIVVPTAPTTVTPEPPPAVLLGSGGLLLLVGVRRRRVARATVRRPEEQSGGLRTR